MARSHTRADEQILFETRSAYQEVVLAREPDGHLNLTLDEVWQFRSQDEHVFHEVLADTPMMLAPSPSRALILGGGDGLAARNLLRYPELEALTLCELDPAVIEMTTRVPEMRTLSEDALADPRVELIVGDALDFVAAPEPREAYDVLICDFPAVTSPALAPLFGPAFYAKLRELTHADSVLAVQVSLDPEAFWPVCSAVEASFPWLHPMLVNLDLNGAAGHDWADFIIASPRAQHLRRGPAGGVRFMRRELVEGLRIQNRAGQQFETRRYGSVDMA